MSYLTQTVEARAVRVGDLLYSANPGDAPCYWWHRVTKTEELADGTIEITCGTWAGFLTRKHPREGLTVQRRVAAAAAT